MGAEPLRSFPPVASPRARVLILGSMPGVRSLQEGRYYAHPQNAFWRITGSVVGFDAALPYAARCQALCDAGIALWDVLRACQREGSLDAAIDTRTAEVQDFAGFFAQHPRVRTVLCNGGTAHDLFVRRALPDLAASPTVLRLPSTSPAYAAMPFAAKQAAWSQALTSGGVRGRRRGPSCS